MRVETRALRSRIITVGGGLVIVLLCLGFVAFVWWRLFGGIFAFTPPEETTDPSSYASIREDWLKTGLVDHFPAAIPSHAKDVRMSFYPGYLQGGAHFQVSMRLPSDEVSAILAEYRDLATHRFQGGDWNGHANRPRGVPTTHYYTSESKGGAFPDSFTILVLRAKDHSPQTWNHGESCGLAIDASTATVVYWAESW